MEAPGFADIATGDYVTATGLVNNASGELVIKADFKDVVKVK